MENRSTISFIGSIGAAVCMRMSEGRILGIRFEQLKGRRGCNLNYQASSARSLSASERIGGWRATDRHCVSAHQVNEAK